MRKIDLENRLKILHQRLTLINLYPEHFESILGRKGVEILIDETLDEINLINEKLNS